MSNPDDRLPHSGADGSAAPPLVASCHCRRVTLQLPSPPTHINECRCTVCYKYGALWAYYKRDTVLVTVAATGDNTNAQADTEKKVFEASHNSRPWNPDSKKGGLEGYIRDKADADGDIGFYRCGHCGCMTHWWGVIDGNSGGEYKMGVNTRLLPEKDLAGTYRKIEYC